MNNTNKEVERAMQDICDKWDKYCIQGTETNPTDIMYYEGFMSAVEDLQKESYQKGFRDGSEMTGGQAEEIVAILKEELKIADERWQRAENHHRQYHEDDTSICDADQRVAEVVEKEKEEEKMECEICHKKTDDVSYRADSYAQDVGNDPTAMHTACDDCDYDNRMDI